MIGQATVGQATDGVLVDTEDGHRGGGLPASHRSEALRWPAERVVGAVLSCRRRRADDALPQRPGGGHGGPREVGLVVGMGPDRSEEHTSELQSLMRISYAVFCLKKKNKRKNN